MILTYGHLKALLQELRSVILGCRLHYFNGRDSRTFLITFKEDIGNIGLLLCFQSPFIRFHLTNEPIENIPNPLTKHFNKILQGSVITNVELLNEDRILCLTFQKNSQRYYMIGEFFPTRPNLYLVNDDRQIIHALNAVEQLTYTLPAKQESPQFLQNSVVTNKEIDELYRYKEREFAFQREKKMMEARLVKEIKTRKKRLVNAFEHLKACQDWEKVQHEAVLLKANLYQFKEDIDYIDVLDWETNNIVRIVITPRIGVVKEIEKRFLKSKKRRAGLEHSRQQFEKIEKELSYYKELLCQLTPIQTEEQLSAFQKRYFPTSSASTLKETQPRPMREFLSASGLTIWVGKSAKDNDRLTFSLARGSDFWFHIRDYSGSHVVLRTHKRQLPDAEALLDAIQLALFYSKAKEQGEGEVCVTQRKHLSRSGKDKSGQVLISKHKVVYTQLDLARIQAIRARCKRN